MSMKLSPDILPEPIENEIKKESSQEENSPSNDSSIINNNFDYEPTTNDCIALKKCGENNQTCNDDDGNQKRNNEYNQNVDNYENQDRNEEDNQYFNDDDNNNQKISENNYQKFNDGNQKSNEEGNDLNQKYKDNSHNHNLKHNDNGNKDDEDNPESKNNNNVTLLTNLIIEQNYNEKNENILIEPQINSLRATNTNTNKSLYEKQDIQQLTYSLVHDYSQLKINKNEQFMDRMEFDVYKRHMKKQHIDQLIEENKVRINEEDRIKAFNRLIEDTNRRLAVKENLNQMKEKLDAESVLSPSKTYRTNEWEQIYEERFKKYNNEYTKRREQMQIEEKARREMIENQATEKARVKKSWNEIQKTVNHLYRDSKLRKINQESNYYNNIKPKHKRNSNLSVKARDEHSRNYVFNNFFSSNTNNANVNGNGNGTNSGGGMIYRRDSNNSRPYMTDRSNRNKKKFTKQCLAPESCCEINITNNNIYSSESNCKIRTASCNSQQQNYPEHNKQKTQPNNNSNKLPNKLQRKSNQDAQMNEFNYGISNNNKKGVKDPFSDKSTKESKIKSLQISSQSQYKAKESNNSRSSSCLNNYSTQQNNDNKIVDYFFTKRLKHLKDNNNNN